jgi:hypothetical protein
VLVDPDVGRSARAEHARKGFAEHGKIKYLISPDHPIRISTNTHTHSETHFWPKDIGLILKLSHAFPYRVSAAGMTLGFNHFW